jgi:hypothetical protein
LLLWPTLRCGCRPTRCSSWWSASGQAGPGDFVVTADIPLAARCLASSARALSPKGQPFTDNDIGAALAPRDLLEELRQGGIVTDGPAPMTAKDRSRFLSKLDEMVNGARRAHFTGALQTLEAFQPMLELAAAGDWPFLRLLNR